MLRKFTWRQREFCGFWSDKYSWEKDVATPNPGISIYSAATDAARDMTGISERSGLSSREEVFAEISTR